LLKLIIKMILIHLIQVIFKELGLVGAFRFQFQIALSTNELIKITVWTNWIEF
jgi:hypothetical protein